MSAIPDIQAALAAAPALPEGGSRGVLLGISARRSIEVVLRRESTSSAVQTTAAIEKVLGLPIRETQQFDGWALATIDAKGRWRAT